MDKATFIKKMTENGNQFIPLDKLSGRPIFGFKDIQMTPEKIYKIDWEKYDCGLLMRGIWAIDIDTHTLQESQQQFLQCLLSMFGVDIFDILRQNKSNLRFEGYSSILEHEFSEELIENFKNTYVESTKSGGLHVLFKKQTGINYSQKIGVISGVDIKANENNYIKIFPSDGRDILQKVSGLPTYNGEFEKTVFSKDKTIQNYAEDKASQVVRDYFSQNYQRFPHQKGIGAGKAAYNRIVEGNSINRNDDLFKATCWAIKANQSLAPLRCLIGTRKGNDIFSESEFEATVKSAHQTVGVY